MATTVYSLRLKPIEPNETEEKQQADITDIEQRDQYVNLMLAKVSCDKLGEGLFADEDAAVMSAKLRIESIMDIYGIKEPMFEFEITPREVIS